MGAAEAVGQKNEFTFGEHLTSGNLQDLDGSYYQPGIDREAGIHALQYILESQWMNDVGLGVLSISSSITMSRQQWETMSYIVHATYCYTSG